MHLSTLFVSTAFALAGMSAALSVERENTLVTRFADSDFLGHIQVRGYDEEAGLYSRGCILSKLGCGPSRSDASSWAGSSFTMNTYPRHRPGSAFTGSTLANSQRDSTPHPGFRTSSALSNSQRNPTPHPSSRTSSASSNSQRNPTPHPSSRTGSGYSGSTIHYPPRQRRSLYAHAEISRRRD